MSWGNPQTANDRFGQAILMPLAWPYNLAINLRQLAYEQNWLSATKLSCPVISVGNLTVGGTGKTPIIIDLASRLIANKIKVGILSRGYARRGNNRCVVVGNGAGKFASLDESGDEALLIAKSLPEAVVIVDHDRVTAGKKAIEEYKCQSLLLDDGFQHWRLARDKNIVLIDYADDPSQDALLPAGRLREPLSALRRATHIIVTKIPKEFDQNKLNRLKQLAHDYAPRAEIGGCQFVNSSLYQLIDGCWQAAAINKLQNMPVVAFCGIARAKGFFDSVKNTGAVILKQISFSDHHHYSQIDITRLEGELKQTGAQYFVTTRKDLVKLESSSLTSRILVINQEIQWLDMPEDIISLDQVNLPVHQTIS